MVRISAGDRPVNRGQGPRPGGGGVPPGPLAQTAPFPASYFPYMLVAAGAGTGTVPSAAIEYSRS